MNTEFECYIDYLNSKNNHKETRKFFKNYEDAVTFMRETFDRVDLDFINYVN